MGTLRHGEHLIQVTRFGIVNCYLVREEDGFTLVDTGLPRTAKALLGAAHEAGGEIVRIVLTHAHGDHAGSVDAVREELPGVELSISERESRLLAGDMSLEPPRPRPSCAAATPRSRPSRTDCSIRATASALWRSWPRPATRRARSPSWTSATGR